MADQLSSDLASLKIDRETRPDRGPLFRAAVWLVVLGGLGALLYFVAWPALSSRIYKTAVETTEIVMISPSQDSTDLISTGYVVAQRKSKVGAKIVGRIAELKVEENKTVEQGQVIARLDDADQRAAIAEARSRATAARARTATARAQLAETKLQLDRERALLAKGAAAKATVEDLEARTRSLAEQVRAAGADVQAADAQVKTLEVGLQYTTIVAPLTGTVIEKFHEEGETVGPQNDPIVEIADLSTQIVETDVSESKLGRVKPGYSVEIVLDADPGTRRPGKVLEKSSRVDRAKATVMVKVAFDPGHMQDVIPGMAARVSFLKNKEVDAALLKEPARKVVPKTAVVDATGQPYVWVIRDGKVVKEKIVLGGEFGGGLVVEQGPPEGTKIVNNPSADLREGQAIKEKN
jgi:RND family efflux transporter MFP subunit